MNNEECVELFEKYLTDEKHSSANTLSSYMRDIRQLAAYIDEHTELTLTTVTADELSEYIEWLRGKGKSVATVSRSIASIKCLYAYLCIHRYIETNPSTKLVPDKGTQKLPQILTSQEVDLLLDQPECIDMKGYRDKAMLELLYATGIRVTELIDLNIDDVNLSAGVIRCRGKDKERFIPMYPKAVKALADYITIVRPQMIAMPVCKRQRRAHVASGLLEDNQALSEESEDNQGHHPAYAASFLCCAPARKRSGHPRDTGNARPRRYILDAGLLAAHKKAAQGCV